MTMNMDAAVGGNFVHQVRGQLNSSTCEGCWDARFSCQPIEKLYPKHLEKRVIAKRKRELDAEREGNYSTSSSG